MLRGVPNAGDGGEGGARVRCARVGGAEQWDKWDGEGQLVAGHQRRHWGERRRGAGGGRGQNDCLLASVDNADTGWASASAAAREISLNLRRQRTASSLRLCGVGRVQRHRLREGCRVHRVRLRLPPRVPLRPPLGQ